MNAEFKCNIIGINVDCINIPIAVNHFEEWITHKEKKYVCCGNTHLISESLKNPELKQALNNAGLVTPDGMPLVWMCHVRGYPEVKRVYGPDLLLAVCEESLKTGWRHYFYGAASGVTDLLVKNLIDRFPGLNVVGISAPPFRSLNADEDFAEVNRINSAAPDILWVSLGAPKQELWMAEHLGKIKAPVMIGVGAAFDFLSGNKKQAPQWMQRSGLEWLFRLIDEPERLWKRYLINNPVFIFNVLLQLTNIKKFPID